LLKDYQMKAPLPLLVRSAALACLLLIAPAYAVDTLDGDAASAQALSAGNTMQVSTSVFTAAGGAARSADGARRMSSDRQTARISTGPLPDMRVEAITQQADGGRSVALVDPANAANTARLQWPQREDNPAANFVQGQTVAFTASPQGTGWMLRAEDGAVLTFVSAIEAAPVSAGGEL